MSPSIGAIVPQHLLPYESEMGASVAMESLILYVCHMDKRPSIPQQWKLLLQVLHFISHGGNNAQGTSEFVDELTEF